MKGALVAFIAKVEGVVQEKVSEAPPQAPSCFAPPIKILAAPLPQGCPKTHMPRNDGIPCSKQFWQESGKIFVNFLRSCSQASNKKYRYDKYEEETW